MYDQQRIVRVQGTHLRIVRLQRVQRYRGPDVPNPGLAVERTREQMERRPRRPSQTRHPRAVRAR